MTNGMDEILPAAVSWVEEQAAIALARGRPLAPDEIVIAHRVGVARPERIRLLLVEQMPVPDTHELRQAALTLGVLGPGTLGLALGYGILIRAGALSESLVAHECAHVRQFEQVGALAAFIKEYLGQIVEHGYQAAPLELDARHAESMVSD